VSLPGKYVACITVGFSVGAVVGLDVVGSAVIGMVGESLGESMGDVVGLSVGFMIGDGIGSTDDAPLAMLTEACPLLEVLRRPAAKAIAATTAKRVPKLKHRMARLAPSTGRFDLGMTSVACSCIVAVQLLARNKYDVRERAKENPILPNDPGLHG
jgi:hypothetical protein